MKLKDVLADIETMSDQVDNSIDITSIRIDSRKCSEGSLFVAIKGFESDGHQHITSAIANGASAILCEGMPEQLENVTYIRVENSRKALAYVARSFYLYPDKKLQTIAITGTNGKTSTASFVQQLLKSLGFRCGLIGTIHYDDGEQIKSASHTTPEAHIIYELMANMLENNCNYVVMEVSSHALILNRVEALQFNRAIFLNFTQDHLDFHKSMDAYFAAKESLFSAQLAGIAILNADDERIRTIDVPSSMSFATGRPADLRLESFLVSMSQTQFTLSYKGEEATMSTAVIGKYNLSNILAAISCVLSFDIPLREIAAPVAELRSVRGRMEKHEVKNKHVLIDYAHTPDALESVLKAARTLCEGKLVCVFGCGGNRDKDKRPKMAKAAEKYVDLAIVTSDNPRLEAPLAIIKDITKGFSGSAFIIESDRRQAIFKGLSNISERDLLIIAGKGHETYQEIQGTRYPFNDAEVILEWT
jgi:UDP-N-acetylmuramoyl-L-alanyl-D-glutamate--2,6-diaminopimelate ligase